MTLLKSMFAALAMFSKLPVPRVNWDKDAMTWAMCFFPLVGVFIGAALYLWLELSAFLELAAQLRAAGALVVPIMLSGGIHMDGFCDTADALASNQDRERKLEILKDTHAGAFAIIMGALYLVVFYAAWCELDPVTLGNGTIIALCVTPVLSRSLSGLAAVTLPNARGTGLLATFTEPMHLGVARLVMVLWLALSAAAIVFFALPVAAAAILIGAVAVYIYYVIMSGRKFGGITGDLAGYFLQMCELGMILAVALSHNKF